MTAEACAHRSKYTEGAVCQLPKGHDGEWHEHLSTRPARFTRWRD